MTRAEEPVDSDLIPDAPSDTVAALGAMGQFCLLTGSRRTVEVRLGSAPRGDWTGGDVANEFWLALNRILFSQRPDLAPSTRLTREVCARSFAHKPHAFVGVGRRSRTVLGANRPKRPGGSPIALGPGRSRRWTCQVWLSPREYRSTQVGHGESAGVTSSPGRGCGGPVVSYQFSQDIVDRAAAVGLPYERFTADAAWHRIRDGIFQTEFSPGVSVFQAQVNWLDEFLFDAVETAWFHCGDDGEPLSASQGETQRTVASHRDAGNQGAVGRVSEPDRRQPLV